MNMKINQNFTNATHSSQDLSNDQPTLIYWLYGYTIIGSVSLIGHTLVARTIMRHSTLNYSPYHLLINLGVCDVGYSFVSMVLAIISVHSNSLFFLASAQVLARVTFIGSVLTLCCLAFDRVLAVKYTLKYQFFARRKAPITMILFSWVLSIVLSVFITIQDTKGSNQGVPIRRSAFLVNSLTMSFGILFIGTCLIYTYLVSRSKLTSLKKYTKCLHGEVAEQYFSLKRGQAINNDVSIVSLFSLATLMPANVLFLKIYISPSLVDKKLLFINWGLGAIYCAVNPFVYLKVMRKLRQFFSTDLASTAHDWKKATSNKVFPGLNLETGNNNVVVELKTTSYGNLNFEAVPSICVVELSKIRIRNRHSDDAASSTPNKNQPTKATIENLVMKELTLLDTHF